MYNLLCIFSKECVHKNITILKTESDVVIKTMTTPITGELVLAIK